MFIRYAAALVLSLGTLAACQDSPVAGREPDNEVTVIHPNDFEAHGITPLAPEPRPASPRLPQGLHATVYNQNGVSVEGHSTAAYNGVFYGNDQVQLITYQNAFSGVSSHYLDAFYYVQYNCAGNYTPLTSETVYAAPGQVGISSQRVVAWSSAATQRAEVWGFHRFTAGSNNISFSTTDNRCA